MSKLETIIVGAVAAPAPPVALFLAAGFSACGICWLSDGHLSEKAIGRFALAGLLTGALLDCLYLRRWTRNVYL